MNLNFYKICVIYKLFFFNCQVFSVTFEETDLTENKIVTYDDLQSNEYLKNYNESGYPIINDSNFGTNMCGAESENVDKSSWFLNVPLLPVIVATSKSIPEGSCKRQLRLYLSHLKNGTLWATEMFDASAKYPYGVFDGFTQHLGSFDQCTRIQTKIGSNLDGGIEEIRSRYCLVDVEFKEKNEQPNFTGRHEIFFPTQVSAWEAIREKGDFRRYRRYLLQMALCFPADCQIEEIVETLKEPLEKFGTEYNLKVNASISPIYCSSSPKEAQEVSNYEIIFYFAFLVIITIVIFSTITDMYFNQHKELSSSMELLSCFSARKNLNEIFSINYGHRGFDSIHFIRVLFAGLAVSVHRIFQYVLAGNISGRHLEWVLSNPLFGVFHNMSIIVDGFFGVAGLLLAYSLLDKMSMSGKLEFVRQILNRLFRLLPLFMFVTFGYATIFYRLGSGPFWESNIGIIRNTCSSYWWTNLLLVNNYFGGNNKCVIQSWYLAVEFQCFIIGLFLISTFYKMPRKIGYIFLFSVLMFSAAIPFYFTYKYDLDPLFKSITQPRRMEDNDYFVNYYVKTHLRLAAYITGLIVGAYIFDLKNSNWRLSKVWSQILFIIIVVLTYTTAWSGTLFMNPNLKITPFVKALYASFQRPIYAFCICSIPLLFTIGDGLDVHYNMIAAKWFQPLSKISYGVYLIHMVVQHYEIGTARTVFTFSIYNSIKLFIGDIVFTICFALFLVVVIELPFRNLGNIFLRKDRKIVKKIQ